MILPANGRHNHMPKPPDFDRKLGSRDHCCKLLRLQNPVFQCY